MRTRSSPRGRRCAWFGRRRTAGGEFGGGGHRDLQGNGERRRRSWARWLDSVDGEPQRGEAKLLVSSSASGEVRNSEGARRPDLGCRRARAGGKQRGRERALGREKKEGGRGVQGLLQGVSSASRRRAGGGKASALRRTRRC
jgi:hypothetical protein